METVERNVFIHRTLRAGKKTEYCRKEENAAQHAAAGLDMLMLASVFILVTSKVNVDTSMPTLVLVFGFFSVISRRVSSRSRLSISLASICSLLNKRAR